MPGTQGSQLGHDHGTCHETTKIEVFMAGSLVADVARLAGLAQRTKDEREMTCFSYSALLVAAAALEAFLSEFAYKTDPAKYTTKYRRMGVLDKYKELTGREMRVDYPDVKKLWDDRNAIGHSEPDNDRSRFVGERVNPAGAQWATATVEQFTKQMLGGNTPDWFRVS